MRRLRIDRLALRLSGVSRQRAGELSSALQKDLLLEVHRQLSHGQGLEGAGRIGELRVPAVRVPAGATARQTSRAVAAAAAAAVKSQRKAGGEGR